MKAPAHHPARRGVRPAIALGVALAGGIALAAPAEAPVAWKLLVEETGVYRVGFEELAAAGMTGPVASSRLALTNLGEPVPLWVADGGDGQFGPGDAIELVGRHLAGEHSHFNTFSTRNVYRLTVGGETPQRMRATGTVEPDASCASKAPLTATQRFEWDRIRLRFADSAVHDQEIWYWAKVTQIDPEPFRQVIDLSDLDTDASSAVRLDIHLRGWSKLPRNLQEVAPDHRIEVALNDRPVGSAEWDNGPSGQTVSLELSASDLVVGDNTLSIAVPRRKIGDDDRAQVDVVMVNWFELRYPRSSRLEADQVRVSLERATDCVTLTTETGRAPVVYGSTGRLSAPESATSFAFRSADTWPADDTVHVVLDGGWLAPLEIEADWPAGLTDDDRRADYIMIAHPSLLEAIQPLARFHESRGLDVDVVDVTDVYDEFRHGIVHPAAIRDFLAHAWRSWERPAPRFVLLVGDASWDARNTEADDQNYADKIFRAPHKTRLAKNTSTPYATGADRNDRNLVPTWALGAGDGQAASDNWFVSIDGDDRRPEMAIGRFPVTEPEEVAAIVRKSMRYAERPSVGPWRRRVLWITNEHENFQQRSDRLSVELADRGFTSEKVYPSSEEESNEAHRETLRDAFDRGQLLVHFFGHGGRYIWRTGPPDLKKNHDLFGLEDLDMLQSSDRLPIVLSMTCYSAPFDHPNADSIGEKFLRLEDRGAVAVVAAAWRNAPTFEMSAQLIAAMTRPGTIGEAFQASKTNANYPAYQDQYNLLGDPALPIALPRYELALELPAAAVPRVVAELPSETTAGKVVVDWIGFEGQILHSQFLTEVGSQLDVTYDGDRALFETVSHVRVYFWDATTGVDALAAVPVRSEEPIAGADTPPTTGGPSGGAP